MLEVLVIHNLALIEKVEVRLTAGLNVLSGETGAGKSIIIDAVSLILGGRASSDMVRSGSDKAVVEVIFSLTDRPDLIARLQQMGYDCDGQLLISRELLSSGRSVSRINGRLSTVAMLRELGAILVDIHGQHEHQSLLRASAQLMALDSFGGVELAQCRDDFKTAYRHWLALEHRLRELTGDERERERKIDLLRYEIAELDDAGLLPDEDEELASDERRLANAARLQEMVEESLDRLYVGGQEQPAAAAVSRVVSVMADASHFDPQLQSTVELLEQIGYQLEEVVDRLRQYRGNLTFEPEQLHLVQQRLDQLAKLKRKYGATCRDMLTYRQTAAVQLHELEDASALACELSQGVKQARTETVRRAESLHERRHDLAFRLEQAIIPTLHRLGMPQARFSVGISPLSSGEKVELGTGQTSRLGSEGIDEVVFLISANAGEPLRPLSRVASGGELSRIMLALRSVLAARDDVPTLIFDEIDAGVGGLTSSAVAEQLWQVSSSRQVLCVTHLAAIAAYADSHLLVAKSPRQERTITTVVALADESRPQELARMLGVNYAGAGAEHARELLSKARQKIM